jgi:hypothetical protein
MKGHALVTNVALGNGLVAFIYSAALSSKQRHPAGSSKRRVCASAKLNEER